MRKIILIVSAFILVITLLNFVSADSYCFLKMGKGEKIHVSQNDFYICEHTICQVCTNSGGWYAAWTRCKDLCIINNPDEKNLTLTINWPFPDNGVLTKQSFILDISTNKIANINLIDNVAGTQKNLCPNCREYRKSYTARQGFNDITIRAVNGGQVKEKRITFFVDNLKPRISKTLPASNKFASSFFTVYYDEANVKEVKINYGISGNMKSQILQNCPSGKKQNCSIELNLKEYDGQEISYWFEIKDIANNIASSRQVKIKVDETSPVINSLTFGQLRNYITFTINVTEKNLDKVYYSDNGEREKILCSSLRNNICNKKLSFKIGEHSVDIIVKDKAGNIVGQNVEFTI